MLTLPKAERILPTLATKLPGRAVKRDVALFQVDAFFAERDEEVAAGVGIDDRLKSDFGLVHLECGNGLQGDGVLLRISAQGADEIADDADVGIERLGSERPAPPRFGPCVVVAKVAAWVSGGAVSGCCRWHFGLRSGLSGAGGSCAGLRRGRWLRSRRFQHADLPLEGDHTIFQFAELLLHGSIIGARRWGGRSLLREHWDSQQAGNQDGGKPVSHALSLNHCNLVERESGW